MYSKLGGCLEITTKLGPLARTDIWAGFTGLLERLMTNLGLDSSLEEPWDSLLGVEVEMMLFSWEDSGALCLGECLQPCLTDLVGLLNCPAWGELVAWGMLLPLLGGRRAVTWEALFPSPEGRWAISLGRNCYLHPKEGEQLLGENCFLCWEEGEQLLEET